MKKTTKKYKIHCTYIFIGFLLFTTNLTVYGQPPSGKSITVSGVYKTDRDGDGVPDVRDKCPDTNKNLEGDTVYADVGGGKTVPIQLRNIKENFENRRRRLLIERSRLLKSQRKTQADIDELKKKEVDRRNELQEKLDKLNEQIAVKDTQLILMPYETQIMLEGEKIDLEIPIMVDEFGCLLDTDRDGVPDMTDKCVTTPGKKDLHGCPDRDGDGIIDIEDDCPDEPGVARLNGCPVRDRDGDGIVDAEDDCPDEPGIPRLNGCPDNDKDGDTVLDKDDDCPDEPGSPANKGCPEVITKEEQKILEEASKVLFHVGSYVIKKESYPILDKVVNLLKKYPEAYISLEGHTDSDGTRNSNQVLSQNRSKSVRNYLVQKGIATDRISFAGYGEDKLLIKPETNAADKQKNRRVEMYVTNKKKDK